jgi:alkylation response protein AidB-like acyl-CoA dehydrogenase
MFFGFDDEQLAFQAAVRDLLDKQCPPEVVRAAWDAPPGQLDRKVWDHLAEMGVLATLVPEDAGGLDLDERSLVLVLEETGRAALPHPIVDTTTVAAPLLAADRGQRHTVDVATGSMVVTDLGGPNVACAADADALLLHHGGALYLVEPAAVRLEPLETVDRGRRAGRIQWPADDPSRSVLAARDFDAAPPAPWSTGEGLLVTDDPDETALAFDRGAFGTAAQLVGLGQRMLDVTVEYVQQRQQFGRPVGAFQAVKHHLADALKELAFARPAVHRAAHSLAVGADTRSRDVSLAKAMASDAACLVGRQALQCHGAIGYTVESDLHLYLKRTWALAAAWGDAAWHRDRIGRVLGI